MTPQTTPETKDPRFEPVRTMLSKRYHGVMDPITDEAVQAVLDEMDDPFGIIHDAMVPGHQRESTSPMEDGTFLADCSCGGTYSVPQGGDEYGALEDAHRRHVAEAEADR